MTHYIGILDGAGSVWGVRIPDLPGCHGAGGTAEAAIADVTSAARAWAEHHTAKGACLPIARPLHEIVADAATDLQPNEIAVMVPVLVDSGRPVRANLSLDAALLKDIDTAAKARGLTRSAFIASAARDKITAEA